MKKTLSLTFLAAMMLFAACERVNREVELYQPSLNRVVAIPSDRKTASITMFVLQIGHDGKNCPGCILNDGNLIHIDCMGDGHYCRLVSAVQLQQIGTTVTATTTDTFDLTTEDFFLMPDRSLNYTDENNKRIFLNIPRQMVYRDTATRQFTFTGLFFSTTATFNND